jgi:hypothetical protein
MDVTSKANRSRSRSVLDKVFPRRLPFFAALFVILPGLYLIVQATYSASYSPLGRDQGIFQYFAWAVRQGDVLYRDIRDVNGPLTTLVHLVFQLLGGEDEHRFRILDLLLTGSVFALFGAILPGLGRVHEDKPTKLDRAAWALAAWVVGSASYLSHLYWDIAQRETFACWFLFGATITHLVGSKPGASSRSAMVWTILAGALAITTWFGKPTFVFFFPGQVLALLWDDQHALTRKKRLLGFSLGMAFGALAHLAFVAIFGDLRAFIQIAIFDAPVLYRYIWARTISEIFAEPFSRWEASLGLLGTVVLAGLILKRKVPRRVLVIALLPLGALASLIAQRKGFMYHFQPLELSSRFVWLTLLVWLTERFSLGSVRNAIPTVVLSAAMGLGAAWQTHSSPHMATLPAIRQHVHSSPERETAEYFALWPEPHFYPWEMRQAAKYVQEHTRPDERIVVYGLDPYFWFLARRLSSTPYVYAYDLNVGAALAGGSGARPDGAAKAKILDMQRAHAADLEAKIKNRPPAAFVFIEHAPMTSYWDDGPRDFAAWCPDAAEWMNERYRETIRFGVVRVFLPE